MLFEIWMMITNFIIMLSASGALVNALRPKPKPDSVLARPTLVRADTICVDT